MAQKSAVRSVFSWLIRLTLLGGLVYGIWWLNQSYAPEPTALARAERSVTMNDTANGTVLTPKDGGNGIGIIFVPGGKVQPLSYAYKLSSVVRAGYTVVITNPLANLAVLDLRSVTSFMSEASGGVSTWFVAGHSLGGVKACQYVNESGKIKGLILLAAYCTNDVKKPTLVISGSRDPLTTAADITAHKQHLPNAQYAVLEDVTHAQFGNYGLQQGDAPPTISDDAVARDLARVVTRFLASHRE